MTACSTVHRWTYLALMGLSMQGATTTMPAVVFTLRANLMLFGLFDYFWVYLADQKRYYPIPNPQLKIRLPSPKIFSLETSIGGEDQEQLGG